MHININNDNNAVRLCAQGNGVNGGVFGVGEQRVLLVVRIGAQNKSIIESERRTKDDIGTIDGVE